MEGSEKKILDFMKEAAYRPLSFKELVRAFGINKDERDRFKKSLKRMVAEGTLIKIRGGRFGLPSKMNLVTGELTCHPDGFGFVCPEGEGEDVYINPRRLSGAMHGDTVAARVDGYKGGGKREGTIIRIIKRAHKVVVGRFERGKGFAVVIPSDERILDQIIIPREEINDAREGMIVSAEITRWPARNLSATGKIVEVIGNPEDPDVEAEVILKKYGLNNRFPMDVMREVKDIPQSVSEEDVKDRVDLRGRTTITIDGETAKDFDDAVSIEKTPHGYRLWVSIADVSNYVIEGSAIDEEAYGRSTSVYFRTGPSRCCPRPSQTASAA
ncbi:MAG: RNB domain-containing ribonuclease [Deltaproteobacteria bacterium]|nr:RNB domain-containing ribonuclease [Deltaproteobacteria bacterium]